MKYLLQCPVSVSSILFSSIKLCGTHSNEYIQCRSQQSGNVNAVSSDSLSHSKCPLLCPLLSMKSTSHWLLHSQSPATHQPAGKMDLQIFLTSPSDKNCHIVCTHSRPPHEGHFQLAPGTEPSLGSLSGPT